MSSVTRSRYASSKSRRSYLRLRSRPRLGLPREPRMLHLPDCSVVSRRSRWPHMNTHHDSQLSGDSPRDSVSPLAWCVVLLVLTAGLSACSRTAAQQPPPPPPTCHRRQVIDREVTEWDEFTGRLEAVDTVSVRPRVSGYVSAVQFTEGALVKQGDLLFQIDPRPFQAEVDRLRAELDARAGNRSARHVRAATCRAPSCRERDVRTRSTVGVPHSPRSQPPKSRQWRPRCGPQS